MKQQEILEFLTMHKQEMTARFGVTRLGLAGSFARGDATEASDIDLIVTIQSDNQFRSFFGLLHYLQDAMPHRIDLATENSLKPMVREQIMKDIRYV